MAINIKFDTAGNPEPPTIILATRSGRKLGKLHADEKSIDISDKFNDASEFSFTLNKYIHNKNKKKTNLWDKVVDFKLVWCKEWDKWFEIKVELDEETETIKTVFCTQLSQAELSQLNLYNIEINTEDDIARDDYKITILYDENDKEASCLDRIIKDKAPHYRIAHVDPTIAKLQRSFSFDNTSIIDAHKEIAEEIGCLFDYPSNSDENGKICRDIYVYDLQQNCEDCGHRGEFTGKCPKCGSVNIKQGYGEDTLIFVTSDELAEGGIQLTTDTDSVKNCFKLEAGDDLMTATVRNCNPNGTDYIWYFSEKVKEDMSKELSDKITEYDSIYKDYYDNYESNINEDLVNRYNELIEKYKVYYNANSSVCLDCDYKGDFETACPECNSSNILIKDKLKPIELPIKGYSQLMSAYYNVVDLSLYLESGLMPSVDISKTKAVDELALLTESSLSPVAVANIKTVSQSTADSAVLAMAKVIVKSTFKVEIKSSELIDNDDDATKIWNGIFIITNYSDEEDTATSGIISVIINDDEEWFVKQKIDKALNKEDTDDLSISGLLKKDYDNFCIELKKYALNPLISFHDACQACIDILIEQGVGSNDTWADENGDSSLYDNLYTPYYNKLKAIEAEIEIREKEIYAIDGVYDVNEKLITEGLKQNIENNKIKIQDALNFEKYLGNDLWLEFCAYRREDTYSNDNYISDGLNNAELFKRASEFVDAANNEIYKSSEFQHSISSTLKNLLAIKKFKHLVESFNVGNWIRVQIDEQIYKLRLLEYEISFGSFDSIPVVFSDVIKIKNGITDVESILSQASSMATSYSYIQRQASKGDEAKEVIDDFITTGLNTALVQIQNNNTEEVMLTKNGLLARSYNDISDTYSDEQLKITHNVLAYTDDNWLTVKSALGKHSYQIYDKNKVNEDGSIGGFDNRIGYGLSADFVTAGIVSGSQIIGGDIYSDNYSEFNSTGSYINLRDGTFSFGGGSLRFKDGKLMISSEAADTNITEINDKWLKTTEVYAENLYVNSAKINGKLTADQINTTEIKVSEFINDAGYQNSSQVTTITKDTVTTEYVNALKITADSVAAENITGTTISGKKLSGGSIKIGNNFSVDESGNLIAKNASVGGDITATTLNATQSGKISIFEIDASQMKADFNTSDKLIDYCFSKGMFALSCFDDSNRKAGWIYSDPLDNGGRTYLHGRNCICFSTYGNFDFSMYNSDETYSTIFGITKGRVEINSSLYVQGDRTTLSGYGNYVTLGKGFSSGNTVFMPGYTDVNGTLYDEDELIYLGSSRSKWKAVYSADGSINTSDERDKVILGEIPQKYLDLYMDLKPILYHWKNSDIEKIHMGLGAQTVETLVLKHDISLNEFSAIDYDKWDTPDKNGRIDRYGLNYAELSVLTIPVVQNHEKDINLLKREVENLKMLITQLTNK